MEQAVGAVEPPTLSTRSETSDAKNFDLILSLFFEETVFKVAKQQASNSSPGQMKTTAVKKKRGYIVQHIPDSITIYTAVGTRHLDKCENHVSSNKPSRLVLNVAKYKMVVVAPQK